MTTALGAPDAPQAMPPGFVVGRLLGRGGSGTVYEARQVSTGRTIALKILDLDAVGPEVLRRFGRERAAMGELAGHPHIVSIIDAGMHAGRPWLAMDLYQGGSLAQVERPIDPSQALSLLHTIGAALTAAHHRGVLHCDVKPGNVLISAYGQPALSDFGIARIALESQGSRIGGYTLDHVPPEILRGDRPTDRGDVYSLATTLFQLLEGRPPFRTADDVSAVSVMRRIESESLPAFTRRDLPRGMAELIVGMTAKDPTVRPTAADVSTRAADIAGHANLPLTSALPVPARPQAQVATVGPAVSNPPPPRYGRTGPPSTAPRTTSSDADDAPTNALRQESLHRATAAAAPQGAAPPRRRRWGRILGGLAALVVLAMIGGGIVTWKLMPTIQSMTGTAPTAAPTTTVAAAPTPAAPTVAPAAPTAAPAASGVPPLYLAQVEENSSSYNLTKQGYGISGQFYPLSINVSSPITSDSYAIDYLLNRQYRSFSTVFGVADEYSELKESGAVPATCSVQVLLDDRPVVPLRSARRNAPITLTNVDVSGGTRLRLVVSQTGSGGGASPYPCTFGNPMVSG
ncbi:protein kinase [Actinomycetospora sp. NBRC 106378]|uniref:protein kinase domain-containing protein n=1 Tax=Actinomycetospora sp. NBRC 106378 TaxID=3032208 RepID=UPI0024A329ED|nr:protein kinase [Actinomycetospora sp. NBRC 106378]GLZ51683.1 hypothetical protein Acsp07_13000 [Actinomycetospora sp. NBRC 106378]